MDLVADELEAHYFRVPGDHGVDVCYGDGDVVDDSAGRRLGRFVLAGVLYGEERRLTGCDMLARIQCVC